MTISTFLILSVFCGIIPGFIGDYSGMIPGGFGKCRIFHGITVKGFGGNSGIIAF